MTAVDPRSKPGLYTLGYVGLTPEQLRAAVVQYAATILDIRLAAKSPASQWRKSALVQLLGERYQHVPALGNRNYRNGGPIQLADPEAALPVIQQALTERSVILLCGCADVATCHRRDAASWLSPRLRVPVRHLVKTPAPQAPASGTSVVLYATGGTIGANPSPAGGTWAYVLVDGADQEVGYQAGVLTPQAVGTTTISNQVSSFVAILAGLAALPAGWSGNVASPQEIALGRICRGYALTGIPPVLVQRGQRVLQRFDPDALHPVLLAGQPTQAQLHAGVGAHGKPVSEHQVTCQTLCQQMAQVWCAEPGACAQTPKEGT